MAKDTKKNPYAERMAAQGVQFGRGRPKKGSESTGTVPRSIRLPEAVWKKLEQRARGKGLTPHAALRAAVIEWLER